MPCFKNQLSDFSFVVFCCFFFGKIITNTALFFWTERSTKGFFCKTVNGIASFGLKTIYLLAVGTKCYIEMQKEQVENLQESVASFSFI